MPVALIFGDPINEDSTSGKSEYHAEDCVKVLHQEFLVKKHRDLAYFKGRTPSSWTNEEFREMLLSRKKCDCNTDGT